MTNVISRLFAREEAARRMVERLVFEGMPRTALQVIPPQEYNDADALRSRLMRSDVLPAAVDAYVKAVLAGHSLFVARTTYRPLGVAGIVRAALSRADTVDVGLPEEEHTFPDGPDHAPSVLKSHPRFLTLPFADDDVRDGPITPQFGFKTITRGRRTSSAISGGRYMSRMFWPQKLISQNRKAGSAISGGRYMSRIFWPQKLISQNRRRNSVIRGGALPLSRALGWPTVSTRGG
ncbi:MAG: hypothetical protein GDA53_06200 [Rhodobacteraceae bacterium]|nr:hypothetical protein [Paracoccaceae bacterium]